MRRRGGRFSLFVLLCNTKFLKILNFDVFSIIKKHRLYKFNIIYKMFPLKRNIGQLKGTVSREKLFT